MEDRYDLRVMRALRQISHASDSYSRKLRQSLKITVPQLVCLSCLIEKGDSMTVSAIGAEAHLSNSTVVGIIDRLEAKGLVKRFRDAKDRRIVNVSITSEGAKLASTGPSPLQDKLTEALKTLSLEEQSEIATSLERVVQLMIQEIDILDEPEKRQVESIGEDGVSGFYQIGAMT